MSAQAIPSTVQNPVTLDLSTSYGALIIAAYLGYIYYWNYPDDSWVLKTLVAFLLIVDTAHKILITKVPWFTLIQNWGRVSAVLASPQPNLGPGKLCMKLGLGRLIIIIVVQVYYLRRLAKFASTTRYARNWWLWGIFMILFLLSISQIPTTVGKTDIFIPINLRLKRSGLIAATIVDLAIAVGMIILLKHTDSVDGRIFRSKRISRTIRRLSIIIVNTGAITAAVAIISLILDETASGTDFWTAIAQYPQCSIYLSAFLANLNARRYIRGDGDGTMTVTTMDDLHFATVKTRRDAEASMPDRADPPIVLAQMGTGTHSGGTHSGGTDGEYTVVGDKASDPGR
ncbi:hypothetical protein K488DRAFT_89961 [Vararia minispora EC-137]|uniref:Uncharacterized protein n=1 Tax=Vararia minispora EC-137 TaxID=1314806 RepID=A0ACB8Q9C1_9AGAM|nr:hypothetical protein K488DRAFT_89961 [Vararia minispora EC-137]